MEIQLLQKAKNMKQEASPCLFEVDYRLASEGWCPFCFGRLKLMRNGKMYWCVSKKHKRKFLISKEKVHV